MDTSKIWRKKVSARQSKRPLLVDNRYTQGVQEKAEALADVFSRANQSRHLPEEVARYRGEEETHFETHVMDNSTPFSGDLTLEDLETAIKGLGSDSKATGKDPISYHMIRRFTESMTKTLLKLFQTC